MGIRTSRLGVLAIGATLTLLGGVATVVSGHGGLAAAAATDVVVVHGTSFPDPSQAGLSLVGCDGMYDVAPETPQPMIGEGPGDAPIGARSLAYDLAGGNAIGPMFRVSSVASTMTASVTVHPWGVPATGVGYVAYQAPDDGDSNLFWLGRTDLSAPGAVWSTINVAHHAFTWTQYDMDTMQVTDQGPDQAQPVSDFADQHGGDGPGVFTVGFGCNGVPFNLDKLEISSSDGSTTYDLEGLTTSVGMSHSTASNGEVTLRGTLRSGSGDPLPDSTLRLEQSDSADGPWRAVGAFPVRDGVASATVQPEDKTWYRWRFVDRPLAAGSTSDTYVVDGTGVEPTASPTASTSTSPTDTPTMQPTDGPTGTPTPSDSPTEQPSDSPSASVSATASTSSPSPSGPASATSSPEPTRTAAPSDSATSSSGGAASPAAISASNDPSGGASAG